MDSSRSADVRKAWREAMDQMDSSRSADVRKAWREAMDQEDNRRSNEDVLLNEMLGSKSKSRIQKESDKSYKALYKSLRKKDEDEPS
jgi:collagenase-like PrtC family protease